MEVRSELLQIACYKAGVLGLDPSFGSSLPSVWLISNTYTPRKPFNLGYEGRRVVSRAELVQPALAIPLLAGELVVLEHRADDHNLRAVGHAVGFVLDHTGAVGDLIISLIRLKVSGFCPDF